MAALCFERMVVVESAGIDQGHIAAAVLCQHLLMTTGHDILGQVGQPGASISDGNKVAAAQSDEDSCERIRCAIVRCLAWKVKPALRIQAY